MVYRPQKVVFYSNIAQMVLDISYEAVN